MNANLDKTVQIKVKIALLKIDAHNKGTCKLSPEELKKYQDFVKAHS